MVDDELRHRFGRERIADDDPARGWREGTGAAHGVDLLNLGGRHGRRETGMCFIAQTPLDAILARIVLLALVLRGAWTLSGIPVAHAARRDAVAVAMIAVAFWLHRFTLAEYGNGSVTAGAEYLRRALADSLVPSPYTPGHLVVASLALVVPAALLVAACWIATRQKDTPFLHERLLRAVVRRLPRPRPLPRWLADRIPQPRPRPTWLADWIRQTPSA